MTELTCHYVVRTLSLTQDFSGSLYQPETSSWWWPCPRLARAQVCHKRYPVHSAYRTASGLHSGVNRTATPTVCPAVSGSGCVSKTVRGPAGHFKCRHRSWLHMGLMTGVPATPKPRGRCYSLLIRSFSPTVRSPTDWGSLRPLSALCSTPAPGSEAGSGPPLLPVAWGGGFLQAEGRGPQCYSLVCTHFQWVPSSCPMSKKNEVMLTIKVRRARRIL